ncbi:MAG: 3-deoxy-D-manno-octulosonic acid transferase [Deltaproteobacteria bacterium]|nr:3-deoxy-D-manno-octulosonic acid transferase [Deltaproteobacteria bacterium]
MLLLYNMIQLLGLVLLWPFLVLLTLCRTKYRARIPARLGFGLLALAEKIPAGRPRIWIHALSVGEVASAVTLVRALRSHFPEAVLLFSASTSSGERYARAVPSLPVDSFLPFPLDAYPVVRRFVKLLRPDLFILIETDFWPNFLHVLAAANVPALLVNGRISRKSYTRYTSLRPFFQPLFDSFTILAMQRQEDVHSMISLGLRPDKVAYLGNLKYDAMLPAACNRKIIDRAELGVPLGSIMLIAGSTHEGEEEIIGRVFGKLLEECPSLFLIIAPRNIERVPGVLQYIRRQGFAASNRSTGLRSGDRVLVLDTMGELAGLYGLADLAFIGGSLVAAGGHNPLEPAVLGTPVFFGPHMEDFADVVEDMLSAGCAVQARTEDELYRGIRLYLGNQELRKEKGKAAREFVESRQGVSMRHIELIRQVLA